MSLSIRLSVLFVLASLLAGCEIIPYMFIASGQSHSEVRPVTGEVGITINKKEAVSIVLPAGQWVKTVDKHTSRDINFNDQLQFISLKRGESGWLSFLIKVIKPIPTEFGYTIQQKIISANQKGFEGENSGAVYLKFYENSSGTLAFYKKNNILTFQHFNISTFQHFNISTFQHFNISTFRVSIASKK